MTTAEWPRKPYDAGYTDGQTAQRETDAVLTEEPGQELPDAALISALDIDDLCELLGVTAADKAEETAAWDDAIEAYNQGYYDGARDVRAEQVQPGYWADDGDNALYYPHAESGEQAAEEYYRDGDYSCDDEGYRVRVRTWQEDGNGDVIGDSEEWHDYDVEPTEPDCKRGHEHNWQQEGDVWGKGGGVIVNEVCAHCGCRKQTDTWATDPATGEQGMTAVSYDTETEAYRFRNG